MSWMQRLSRLGVLCVVAAAVVAASVALAGCSSDEPTADDTTQSGNQDTSGGQTAGGEDAEEPATAQDTPEELTVRLYFSSAGENAMGIERTIPYTQAVAAAAMEELLAGPTDAELTTWPALSSQIPEGTELLGLTIEDGIAKVDLSGEFAAGGGTFSMTARLAQVVYTLCDFDSVDSVEFYMDGEAIDVFSGEGIILDGPQTPEDYYDLLPVDA